MPQEALITTMQDNQKYFCLLDVDGKLLPRFITVANIESKDPRQIIEGNEKVVRPRLTDAEFFFKQDKKQKLEDFNQRLQNVVFQEKLGSVYDKAERVSNLLSKVEGSVPTTVEAKYFDNANEFSLYSAIQQADQAVQPMAAARQYSETLARLAALREPVDAFFEKVMVNAEDANVRANRYALLARLRGLFLGVADISLLG